MSKLSIDVDCSTCRSRTKGLDCDSSWCRKHDHKISNWNTNPVVCKDWMPPKRDIQMLVRQPSGSGLDVKGKTDG